MGSKNFCFEGIGEGLMNRTVCFTPKVLYLKRSLLIKRGTGNNVPLSMSNSVATFGLKFFEDLGLFLYDIFYALQSESPFLLLD